jgi:hypothetical protein
VLYSPGLRTESLGQHWQQRNQPAGRSLAKAWHLARVRVGVPKSRQGPPTRAFSAVNGWVGVKELLRLQVGGITGIEILNAANEATSFFPATVAGGPRDYSSTLIGAVCASRAARCCAPRLRPRIGQVRTEKVSSLKISASQIRITKIGASQVLASGLARVA